ncbi:MAG: GMC family oxidoreductase N-terminal domain-containing protein [Bacillota bacterium]
MGVSRRSFLKAGITLGAAGVLSPPLSSAEPIVQHLPVNVHYRKLANSSSNLKDSYDVVVVGSGYGGSVMAARLAEGRSLALLERGPERPPGSFAETLKHFIEDVRTHRNPLGLFDFHLNHEMDVLTGNGLGGTSLINAGVIIEPDTDTFRRGLWPDEIVAAFQTGEMRKYFSLVKESLRAQRFDPRRLENAKVAVHRYATEKLKQKFEYASIAVNLYGHKPFLGVQQPRCIQCGNCCAGCNTGAKNTLNMNYLPLAKSHGAEIYTRISVDHIEKLSQGYRIHCDVISEDKVKYRKVIEARTVIISAGTMGSAGLLMKSRTAEFDFSDQLGKRFSANGDVLGLSFNTAYRTDAIGFSSASEVRVNMKAGAVIYGIADYREGRNLSERFLIEEGTFPGAVAGPLRLAMAGAKLKQSRWRMLRVLRDLTLSKDIEKGALNHSMVYLGMGHDRADGSLFLDGKNRVRVHWPEVLSDPVFPMIDREMKRQSQALDGDFVMNPRSMIISGKNLVTVHPLGGCVMGQNVEQGVVNHVGQVFQRDGSLHEGLYVMDGSVIATSLGVNPLLTISALAERAAQFIKHQC